MNWKWEAGEEVSRLSFRMGSTGNFAVSFMMEKKKRNNAYVVHIQ